MSSSHLPRPSGGQWCLLMASPVDFRPGPSEPLSAPLWPAGPQRDRPSPGGVWDGLVGEQTDACRPGPAHSGALSGF